MTRLTGSDQEERTQQKTSHIVQPGPRNDNPELRKVGLEPSAKRGTNRITISLTINIDNIIFADNTVILLPNKTLKHTSPNRCLKPLTYHKYEAEKKLCIANWLKSYLEKWNYLVNEEVRELLITYGKSYKIISWDPVGRWIKNKLTSTGVDTTVF